VYLRIIRKSRRTIEALCKSLKEANDHLRRAPVRQLTLSFSRLKYSDAAAPSDARAKFARSCNRAQRRRSCRVGTPSGPPERLTPFPLGFGTGHTDVSQQVVVEFDQLVALPGPRDPNAELGEPGARWPTQLRPANF